MLDGLRFSSDSRTIVYADALMSLPGTAPSSNARRLPENISEVACE